MITNRFFTSAVRFGHPAGMETIGLRTNVRERSTL